MMPSGDDNNVNGGGSFVLTPEGQQYYRVDHEGHRTVLVPVRSTTPPPTYDSLFGEVESDDQSSESK